MPAAGLFFQGLAAGFAGGIGAATASIIGGAAASGAAIGTFLGGTVLGNLLLNVGVSALIAALNRPDAPRVDLAQVNSRTGQSFRWQALGPVKVGGEAAVFGEHDEAGNFWYIVAHADAEMTSAPTYYLDDIEVQLSDGTDGYTAGDVLTDDFCVNTDGKEYPGTGTKVPIFRLYTVTPTTSAVYGALPAAFTTAFPDLPADFYLAGVSYTIVRCRATRPENYYIAMRWGGPFGLGEPRVGVYASFNRVPDIREMGVDVDDPTTWVESDGNPVLLWAAWRINPYGMGKSPDSVNWTEVEAAADECDATVLDGNGDPIPLYRGGFAFRDDAARGQCEQQILETMDAFLVTGDDGKVYPVIGKYVAPTLTITADRDIISAQTQIVDDGEAALDGVIVRYLSPDHNYQAVPCAPWVNDDWYDGTSEPNFVTIDRLGCQNHNQAVRLAKAFGRRVAATKRAALGTGIKGTLAKNRRAITLDWDADFSGEYQMVGPVEESEDGMAARMVVVPMRSDDWTLNPGEEGDPPALVPSLNIDTTLELAASVSITSETVYLAGAVVGVRLNATFDAPTRVDRFFRFRFVPTAGGVIRYFTTDMDELEAVSELVDQGTEYRVSWQTITGGGRATVWSDERGTPVFVDITAAANDSPGGLAGVTMTDGTGGEVDYSATMAANANVNRLRVYRATTGAGFGAAVQIGQVVTTPGATVTGSAASALGLADFYLAAVSIGGTVGTPSGPYAITIT